MNYRRLKKKFQKISEELERIQLRGEGIEEELSELREEGEEHG